MVFLKEIHLRNFRNFKEKQFDFKHPSTLLVEKNGWGKTSLLEALHVLSLGRSFRVSQLDHLIHRHENRMEVTGIFNQQGVDIPYRFYKQLSLPGYWQAGQKQETVAHMTREIPVQALHRDTFFLLHQSSDRRRRFIDWLTHQQCPEWLENWQRYQKALKQRNALLKQRTPTQSPLFTAFETEMAQTAFQVERARQNTLAAWKPPLLRQLHDWNLFTDWDVSWYSGFRATALQPFESPDAIAQFFQERRPLDQQVGFTRYGIHRGDLVLMAQGSPAAQFLSAGQLKRLIVAMFLARTQLLPSNSLLLIDDLTSELDLAGAEEILEALSALKTQIIMTAIPSKDLQLTNGVQVLLEAP